MNPEHETIRIGVSGARIVAVTRKRIDYIDMAGKEQFIDLEESAKGFGLWYASQEFLSFGDASEGSFEESIAAWNANCVGKRGALEDPPWAEFMNARNTRFEFATEGALYGYLLVPLEQVGWDTFDWD